MSKLLFLGTGGSVGIPVIGCSCVTCSSTDPLNKRLRPSVLLLLPHRKFLIDVGPDFRMQALHYGIIDLDGVLLTHAHHDHVSGIDDLRPLCYRRQSPLPILLSRETAEDLRSRYYYLFQNNREKKEPSFDLQVLPHDMGQVMFEGILIQYVSYKQGGMSVNGFRIGDLAYLSDIRDFSPSLFEKLKGTKYLIISALRHTPSPLHFCLDEAIEFGKQLKAEHIWLTHVSHDLEHHQTTAHLPSNVHLAYDGLEINF